MVLHLIPTWISCTHCKKGWRMYSSCIPEKKRGWILVNAQQSLLEWFNVWWDHLIKFLRDAKVFNKCVLPTEHLAKKLGLRGFTPAVPSAWNSVVSGNPQAHSVNLFRSLIKYCNGVGPYGPSHHVLHLPFVKKLYLQSKFNQISKKMQKQRQAVKQD